MQLSNTVLVSNFLDQAVTYMVSRGPSNTADILPSGYIGENRTITISPIAIGDELIFVTDNGKTGSVVVSSTGNSKFLARYNLVVSAGQLTVKDRINQRSNGEILVLIDKVISSDFFKENRDAVIYITSFMRSRLETIIDGVMFKNNAGMADKSGIRPNKDIGSNTTNTSNPVSSDATNGISKKELLAVSGIIILFIAILAVVLLYLYHSRISRVSNVSPSVAPSENVLEDLSILI